MSKLAIVLCAVGFCVSVIVDSSELPWATENEITRRMDEALNEIDRISGETYKKVLEVDPKKLAEKKAPIVEYKEGLAKHLRVLKFHVDQILASGRRENFNEKKCRKHFNKYKTVGHEFLAEIQAKSEEALRNVSFKYGTLLRITKQTIENIKLARTKGLGSNSNPEDYYRATAMREYHYFSTSTDDFLQFLGESMSGVNIMKKMDPLVVPFVNNGQEVMAKTYNCVFFPI